MELLPAGTNDCAAQRHTHFENGKSLSLLRHGQTPAGVVYDAAPRPLNHTAPLDIQTGFIPLTCARTEVIRICCCDTYALSSLVPGF